MNLKNVFFKEDPKGTVTEKAVPQSIPAQTTPVTSQMITNVTGVADEKFIKILQDAIVQNNIPGQDYFEFKQTFDAMNSISIDEKTKFLTIFTTFQVQGCKKETLLTSIDKYIEVVQNEEANFNAELASQKATTVTNKLNEIEEARKKVAELNKEITDLNTFIISASQEAQAAELKLQLTESNFKKSAEKVISMLTTDKEKINTYIQ